MLNTVLGDLYINNGHSILSTESGRQKRKLAKNRKQLQKAVAPRELCIGTKNRVCI